MRQMNRKSHEILMAPYPEGDPGKLSYLPQWLKLHLIYHSLLKIKRKLRVVIWDFPGRTIHLEMVEHRFGKQKFLGPGRGNGREKF